MFFPLVGLVFVGGATLLSRGSRSALAGIGVQEVGSHTSDALEAMDRASATLFPARGRGQFVLMDDATYLPKCDDFRSEALEALNAARLAENNLEPLAHSARIAAVQAWALSQVECGGDEPDWVKAEVEKPL